MAVFDRIRQAPPSVSGRSSHDVLIGLADAAVAGLWALSGAIRRVAPPAEHDRGILVLANSHQPEAELRGLDRVAQIERGAHHRDEQKVDDP